MGKCPYTWFKSFFTNGYAIPRPGAEAQNLRVAVVRNNETVVDVAFPARSARWLMELIPDDVIVKLKEEGIPIEGIHDDLAQRPILYAEKIFDLIEENRSVHVWLE